MYLFRKCATSVPAGSREENERRLAKLSPLGGPSEGAEFCARVEVARALPDGAPNPGGARGTFRMIVVVTVTVTITITITIAIAIVITVSIITVVTVITISIIYHCYCHYCSYVPPAGAAAGPRPLRRANAMSRSHADGLVVRLYYLNSYFIY